MDKEKLAVRACLTGVSQVDSSPAPGTEALFLSAFLFNSPSKSGPAIVNKLQPFSIFRV